jgi:hypothetical protein
MENGDMTTIDTIARTSKASVGTTPVGDTGLTAVIVFCAVGLLVSLLLVGTYGLDLSPGFF